MFQIQTRTIFPKKFPSLLRKNLQILWNKSHVNHEQSLDFLFWDNQKFGEFF
jgi:hypothetical protein